MAVAATVVRFVSPAQANTPPLWSAMAAVRRCLSSASSTTSAAGQGGYRGGSPQQGLRVLHRQRGHRVGCQPLSLQMVALLALLLSLARSVVAASLDDASSVENLSTGGVGGGVRGGGSRTCEAAGVCDPGSSARWKAAQWHGFYYVLAGLLLWPCSICLVLVLANRGHLGFARSWIRWCVTRAHDQLVKLDDSHGDLSSPTAASCGDGKSLEGVSDCAESDNDLKAGVGRPVSYLLGGRRDSGSSWSGRSGSSSPSSPMSDQDSAGSGRRYLQRRPKLSDVCEEDAAGLEMGDHQESSGSGSGAGAAAGAVSPGGRGGGGVGGGGGGGATSSRNGGQASQPSRVVGGSSSSWKSDFSSETLHDLDGVDASNDASCISSCEASSSCGGDDPSSISSPGMPTRRSRFYSGSEGGRAGRGGDRWGGLQLMTDEELCAELDAEEDARRAVAACMDDTSLVFQADASTAVYPEEGVVDQRQRSISLGVKHHHANSSLHKDKETAMAFVFSLRTPPQSPGSPRGGRVPGGGDVGMWVSRYKKDFDEVGRIGRGGFGSVYRCRQKLDGREYAVKKVKLSSYDEAKNKRLTREVKNMAALSAHAHIVRYFGTWVEVDRGGSEAVNQQQQQHSVKWLYIQMELCGTSVRQWMDGHEGKGIAIEDVHSLIKEVAEGLRFVHSERFIHRDIKPDNIFVVNGVAKLGDFGLSCKTGGELDEAFEGADSSERSDDSDGEDDVVTAEEHTRGVGTSLYAAPELSKNGKYDSKVDIYSLGIVLFELLVPFNTRSERATVLQSLRKSLQTPALAAATSLLGCPLPVSPPASSQPPPSHQALDTCLSSPSGAVAAAGGGAGGGSTTSACPSPSSLSLLTTVQSSSSLSLVSCTSGGASTSQAPNVMSLLPVDILRLAKTRGNECTLVLRLLSLDPRMRPSAEQLLDLPWLQTSMEETVQRQKDQIRMLTEQMNRMASRRSSPNHSRSPASSSQSPHSLPKFSLTPPHQIHSFSGEGIAGGRGGPSNMWGEQAVGALGTHSGSPLLHAAGGVANRSLKLEMPAVEAGGGGGGGGGGGSGEIGGPTSPYTPMMMSGPATVSPICSKKGGSGVSSG